MSARGTGRRKKLRAGASPAFLYHGVERPGVTRRAIAPVIGVALLVVVTLLLASMFAVGAMEMVEFGMEREQVDALTGGETDGYRAELIWARDDGAGATTAHVVNYTIAPGSDTVGNSLNSVEIRYPDGSANVSDVDERSDVVTVGIDRDRDGEIEVDATSDVECCPPGDGVVVADDGNTLRIELSGNYGLEAGDALIVEYEAVENPGSGDYSVTVDVNGDVTDSGTLTVA
jgi:flagellin-like protein